MKDVEKAAKEANALDFIKTLPSGFDTNCGKKGSQLSGNVVYSYDAKASVFGPKIWTSKREKCFTVLRTLRGFACVY